MVPGGLRSAFVEETSACQLEINSLEKIEQLEITGLILKYSF